MLLTCLSPAEVLILQHIYQAPVRHMLRLTFADLVLRDVLRLQNQPFQASAHEAPVDCYYVRPGNAWGAARARPHEIPLLRPLPEGRRMLLLRNYAAVLLEQVPPAYEFRLLVAQSPGLNGCIQRGPWHKLWKSFALTPTGLATLRTVQEELASLKYGHPVTAWPPGLYGTSLLAGSALPMELQLFDHELLRALRVRRGQPDTATVGPDSSSEGGSGDFSGNDFGGGHSGGGGASGDFGDSGGDFGGHTGDSGCSSGCSGCSGCSGSGCSGCGGCGGGGD